MMSRYNIAAMRFLMVLVLASTVQAQVAIDEAYAKLRAKQQATKAVTPATAPAEPQKPTLSHTLDELVRKADGIVDVSTVGQETLTTAQRQAEQDRIAQEIADAIGEYEGARMSAKILVVDVVSRRGEYVVVGETTIPAPPEIQKEMNDQIRELNRLHDERIKHAKTKDYSSDSARESAILRETQQADQMRATYLAQIKAKYPPLKAIVHLIGGPELIRWSKGDTKSLDVITVDQIKLQATTLKRSASRDITYIGRADVYAAIGSVRRTTSWKEYDEGGRGAFGKVR